MVYNRSNSGNYDQIGYDLMGEPQAWRTCLFWHHSVSFLDKLQFHIILAAQEFMKISCGFRFISFDMALHMASQLFPYS